MPKQYSDNLFISKLQQRARDYFLERLTPDVREAFFRNDDGAVSYIHRDALLAAHNEMCQPYTAQQLAVRLARAGFRYRWLPYAAPEPRSRGIMVEWRPDENNLYRNVRRVALDAELATDPPALQLDPSVADFRAAALRYLNRAQTQPATPVESTDELAARHLKIAAGGA